MNLREVPIASPELEVPVVDYINMRNNFSGARFLRECCTKLEASIFTMATAATYYHKFFSIVEFDDYDPYLISATCIYLASKTRNDDIKIRDIINVSHHCIHRSDEPLALDDYFVLRDSLVNAEFLLMRVLEFELTVDLPHKHMLFYLASLRDWIGTADFEKSRISETCMTLLLDSYHLPIVLSNSPELIAASMIFLTFQIYGVMVPGSSELDDPTWYSVLHPDCTAENIQSLTSMIVKLYALESKLDLEGKNKNEK